MSIFKSIVSAVVKSPVGKALDVVATTFNHPLQVATAIVSSKSTVKEVVEKHFSEPLKQQNIETIANLVTYAAGVYGAGKVAAKGLITPLIKKAIIPKTVTGLGVRAGLGLVAIPAAVGYTVSQPQKAVTFVESIPTKVANVVLDTFSTSKELATPKPDLKTTLITDKDTVFAYLKAHPFLTVGTAFFALLTAGFAVKGLSNLISQYFNTQAIQKQTEAIKDSGEPQPIKIDVELPKEPKPPKEEKQKASLTSNESQIIYFSPLPAAEVAPIPPTAAAVSTPVDAPKAVKTKAKKKKAKKKTTKKKAKKKTTKKKAKKKTTKKKAKKKTTKKKKKSIKRKKN